MVALVFLAIFVFIICKIISRLREINKVERCVKKVIRENVEKNGFKSEEEYLENEIRKMFENYTR